MFEAIVLTGFIGFEIGFLLGLLASLIVILRSPPPPNGRRKL